MNNKIFITTILCSIMTLPSMMYAEEEYTNSTGTTHYEETSPKKKVHSLTEGTMYEDGDSRERTYYQKGRKTATTHTVENSSGESVTTIDVEEQKGAVVEKNGDGTALIETTEGKTKTINGATISKKLLNKAKVKEVQRALGPK